MRHWLAIIMATLALLAAPTLAKEPKMSTDPKVAVVQNMITAWNTRNWPLVANLFTEDGVLHSMMIEPVVGRKAIDARVSAMGAGISEITLNIKNIGRVGDVVFIERVDSFTYNGHKGEVPVVGVLEVEGDKIKVWREYYDRAELVAAMGLRQDFHKPTQ
nr:nuclear transport factor 2 family protein [Polymorphobacter sp.]